jgi:abortive infection bacteriophage resistance protein
LDVGLRETGINYYFGHNTDALAFKAKQEFAAQEKARQAVAAQPKPI